MRRWSVILTACTLFVSSALSGCVADAQMEPVDASRVTLLQTEPLREGEDLAIINTSAGEIRIRFFPSEAPKAVENFKKLVRDGFYSDQAVYGPSGFLKGSSPVLISGSNSPDGKSGVSALADNKPFKKELSVNLWHFTGAVSVLGDKNDRGDSRFFITGSQAVQQDVLDLLEKAKYPPKVVDMFEKCGGVPDFALEYTVFAQVVQGQDVVDKIIGDLQKGERVTIGKTELVEYSAETIGSSAG